MFAEQLESDTEGLLTAEAVFACSVADPGIHYDKFICSIHDSDGIRAHYPAGREIDAGEASQDEQIEMIQSSREDADAELAGSGLRDWQIVAELQLFEAAVARDG